MSKKFKHQALFPTGAVALLAALALGASPVQAPAETAPATEGPHYTLVAKFATYPVHLEYNVDKNGKLDPYGPVVKSGKFLFETRTWTLDGKVGNDYLGPTLTLEPGQHFEVTVKNDMFEKGKYAGIGPRPPQLKDWLPLVSTTTGPYAIMYKTDPVGFAMFGKGTPQTPLSKFYIDTPNLPRNFDDINLHLHGLQITPHLFDPVGTTNPKSDYITIKPGHSFTYAFTLPKDHPTGTYWYHPHRHNSVAIQAWSGMAGLLIVKGTFDRELANYGVKSWIPFVINDPHYVITKMPKDGKPGVAKVGAFLLDQNAEDYYTFMVNGHYRPVFTVKRNEIVHVRELIATVENIAGFRIVRREGDKPGNPPATDAGNIPFYVVGSDGVAYPKPVRRTLLVGGGGERHDLLLQFPKPGTYDVWSDNLQTVQFYGTGPKNQLLATFKVTDQGVTTKQTPIDQMTFTPGMAKSKDITRQDIMRQRHFVFDVDTNTLRIPFPQFKINDWNYRPDMSRFSVKAGNTEEWVITNPSWAIHPVHIHVTPFQVREDFTASTVDKKLVPKDKWAMVQRRIDALARLDYPNEWRDTLIVPPKGVIRLWIHFPDNLTGKTVMHCHFLAHEDTGMIVNFIITPKGGDQPKDR